MIIGTLQHTENSFTRFAFEDGQIQAVNHGVSGHTDGEIEVIGSAANFDQACRTVAKEHSPYGKNPNFTWEMSGRAWVANQ